MTKHKGVTLIELVIVMAIIGLLAVSGAWLMAHLVRNSVFIPSQLNMDMVASGALDIMIEGDSVAKGLRFSKSVVSIPDNNEITFLNQNGQSVRYRLDAVANKLYRSINSGPETAIPYYVTPGINLMSRGAKFFTYYDTNGVETADAADVSLIQISLIAQTGTGSYADWEGRSGQSSAIAVDKFQ